jgi:dTDP-4-amino-4,6-dideoxygalactose transaminase
MDEVMHFAQRHNLRVIEDTAQALGSTFKSKDGSKSMAGCIGDIGTTSFFPSKNLGGYGDGGAMMTNDDALAEKLRMISNHGQSVRYYHDIIGCNSRLDSIQAAVLRVKLRYLNEYITARQQAAAFYNDAFKDIAQITTPYVASFSTHGFHQYTIKLEGVNRDGLMQYLQDNGIPANIYYPVPVHLQKGYTSYGFKEGDMPRTEELTRQVLSLPIHTELTEEQLIYITTHIKRFIAG